MKLGNITNKEVIRTHHKSTVNFKDLEQTFQSCFSDKNNTKHINSKQSNILNSSFNADENSFGGTKTLSRKGTHSMLKINEAA
jgi:hypothetical protein